MRCSLAHTWMMTAFAVAALSPASARAGGNLVLNGGFSTADFTDWTVSQASGPGVISDITVRIGPAYNPNGTGYGASFAEFTSDGSVPPPPFDSISQNLATIAGEKYTLTFYLQNNGGPTNEFQAYWNGTKIQDIVNANQFSFTQYQFTEVATSSSTVLEFAGFENPAQFALTDIVVTQNVVPEPSSLLLFGIAAAGITVLVCQQQRNPVEQGKVRRRVLLVAGEVE
jgi:PEP-CTERM motif